MARWDKAPITLRGMPSVDLGATLVDSPVLNTVALIAHVLIGIFLLATAWALIGATVILVVRRQILKETSLGTRDYRLCYFASWSITVVQLALSQSIGLIVHLADTNAAGDAEAIKLATAILAIPAHSWLAGAVLYARRARRRSRGFVIAVFHACAMTLVSLSFMPAVGGLLFL